MKNVSSTIRPLSKRVSRVRRGMRRRSGLTLIEILLASVILAGALAALSQQNATGVEAALRSQLETEAAVKCQSKLNRLLAEGLPAADATNQAIEGDERWRWSAKVGSSDYVGLKWLTVTVHQNGRNKAISTFSLSRLFAFNEKAVTQ